MKNLIEKIIPNFLFIRKIIPNFLLNWYHFLLAYLGAFIYGFPTSKIIVIGISGTRGKTTTANFIWSCLNSAGYKTGLTSTANIRIEKKEILNPYHMTMPGRFVLQRLLSQISKAGCQYAIIETPSEGIEQYRHKGINYDIVVFTSLYPEYLKVHNWDFERCKRKNLEIFTSLKKQKRKVINGKKIPKIIVVNNDDSYKDIFIQCEADKKITYSINSLSDFKAESIKINSDDVSFFVGQEEYKLNILGEFNVYNALAAIAVSSILGIDNNLIKKGLENLPGVPGRMEKIDIGQGFSVFVDYAHDPKSLEAILKTAKAIKKPESKIILLLGAEGGGRDKTKRPIMGEVAAKNADFVIVSNVDPYDDDPKEILEDVAQATEKAGKIINKDLFVIEDRREGIKKAISLAKENDIVLITGKGAEQTMIIGSKEIPWDDREIVKEELEKLYQL